jgi:hypothetical protein
MVDKFPSPPKIGFQAASAMYPAPVNGALAGGAHDMARRRNHAVQGGEA